MRRVILLIVAIMTLAAWQGREAAAQGLLHKHRHAAGAGMGMTRPLPALDSAMAVTASGAVSSADGATNATIAAVPLRPPAGGGVPGAGGGAAGVMPIHIAMPAALDGAPLDATPMPSIGGMPPIACIDYPTAPPGFDPGATVFVGGWPDASGPPALMASGGLASAPPGMPHPFRGTPMDTHTGGNGRGHATAMSVNAFGQATAAAATPPAQGRAVAAGLPGRAVGVRPGTLDVPGRRQMTPIGTTGPEASTAGAAAGTRPNAGVIQAAGGASTHDGVSHAVGRATPAASSASVAAPPRWRDRLRFAWPATK